MFKYFLMRLLRGMVSIVIVIAIIMLLIYSLLDRTLIFQADTNYQKQAGNALEIYTYKSWRDYGYLDYVNFNDYIVELNKNGELEEGEDPTKITAIAGKEENDSELTKKYTAKFRALYESKGYTVNRLEALYVTGTKLRAGGQPYLYAYRDKPLINRIFTYFTSIIKIDNIHNASGIPDNERKIYVTMHDPVYNGKFVPAIMGNGTNHKYLLYFDSKFPFIHQNLISINLGKSYSINTNIEIVQTMTQPQGQIVKKMVTFPTGLKEESADDLHSAVYVEGSLNPKNIIIYDRFTDDYTSTLTFKSGKSKLGYSFTIGIIATFLSYLIGIPLGVLMARNKDKLFDKIGTIYIIFIIAVPSLAYIFMFKGIGTSLFKLPGSFTLSSGTKLIYVLPIVSLALPSVAGLMRWIRRYMIDQSNSDYVKFARSGGLSEREIFNKHILKNAIIPIVHGIPGSILVSLTGAIITERVYIVPGVGQVLTKAINQNDNGVIVGISLFYAALSVISVILGDILMAAVDPRISFTEKGA